jgi:hypothetical protein
MTTIRFVVDRLVVEFFVPFDPVGQADAASSARIVPLSRSHGALASPDTDPPAAVIIRIEAVQPGHPRLDLDVTNASAIGDDPWRPDGGGVGARPSVDTPSIATAPVASPSPPSEFSCHLGASNLDGRSGDEATLPMYEAGARSVRAHLRRRRGDIGDAVAAPPLSIGWRPKRTRGHLAWGRFRPHRARGVRTEQSATVSPSASRPRRRRNAPPRLGADAATRPGRRRSLIAAGLAVALGTLAVAAAMSSPLRNAPTAAPPIGATTPADPASPASATPASAPSPTICRGPSPTSPVGCTRHQSSPSATGPGVIGACVQLIETAAQTLRVDPDSYARVILAISLHTGRTMNELVHEQLVGQRTYLVRQLEQPGFSSNANLILGVNALTADIQRIDATPCADRPSAATPLPVADVTMPDVPGPRPDRP